MLALGPEAVVQELEEAPLIDAIDEACLTDKVRADIVVFELMIEFSSVAFEINLCRGTRLVRAIQISS